MTHHTGMLHILDFLNPCPAQKYCSPAQQKVNAILSTHGGHLLCPELFKALKTPLRLANLPLECRSSKQVREWQRWHSLRHDMAGSVVRELYCQNGLYRAELEPMQ